MKGFRGKVTVRLRGGESLGQQTGPSPVRTVKIGSSLQE